MRGEFFVDTGARRGVGPALDPENSSGGLDRRDRAMGKLEAVVLLSVLCVAAPGLATRASSCTVDAECDNGDTCSVADACVNGGCVLGGGGDTDGDYICDGEFNAEADVNVNKVVAKMAAGIGRLRGTGSFIDLGSAGGAFTGADGVSIRVKDTLSTISPPGDGIDFTMVFPASSCQPTLKGGVTCLDALTKSQAKFSPTPRAVSQFSFSFRIRRVPLTRPFFGPVTVILTHNRTVHRRDSLSDCKLYGWGIKCREF